MKHKFEVRCHSGFLIDWAMAGRNLKVNHNIVPPHLNDFRHELFTMSWKPIMLFKLDRVCCMNVTPTNMGLVSAHKNLYEEAQDQNGANLLLDLYKDKRGLTRPINHELRSSVDDGVVHSVTGIPIVGVDSGAGVTVQSFLGNNSSIGHSSLPHTQEQPKNTTAGTSKDVMLASLPANGSNAVMANSSVNSNVVYQPTNDLMATSEIGHQIGENGGSSSSSSPQLKRKLNSDETNTTCVFLNKKPHPTTAEFLIDARADIDDITLMTNTPLAKTTVALTTNPKKNKSEETNGDPISWILTGEESNGEQGTGQKESFYCRQEHFAKIVGDDGDTICTSDDMKVVDKKGDLLFYKLTDQTCCEKKVNCIFVTGKYSNCEKWSEVPLCGNIYYCNMCARFGQHRKVNEYVTSMCVFCKLSCQQMGEKNRSTKGDSSEGQTRPRQTHKQPITYIA